MATGDTNSPNIYVAGVHKTLGGTEVVRQVNFAIEAAQLVAFVGCNGSGKTTVLQILSGFRCADSGIAKIAGFDMHTARTQGCRHIGYVPERAPLPKEMEVRAYLRFRGQLKDVPREMLDTRIASVAQELSVDGLLSRTIGDLSKGMQQRIAIADALLAQPKVLLLDEPSSGLDPLQQMAFHRLLVKLGGTRTVLFSSHDLAEVEALGCRVLVLHGGTIVGDGTAEELREKIAAPANTTLREVFGQLVGSPPQAPLPSSPPQAPLPSSPPQRASLGRWMTHMLLMARKDLRGFFLAPMAYWVAAAFAGLNGYAFWGLLRVVSDPLQHRPAQAVLHEFFGGTLLHWLLVFVVVAVLSMGSVAESRRRGLWESTVTTGIDFSSLILGKWIALVVFYLLLWLPTLLLIAILAEYLPAQSLELGPIVAAYLGVFAIGGALLAIGIAISSFTQHQVVAATMSFALFVAWLMVGESFQHLFTVRMFADLRTGLMTLATGELQGTLFVALATVVAIALSIAIGRTVPSPAAKLRWGLAALLMALLGSSVGTLVLRYGESRDWTRAKVHTLAPSTQQILARVAEPIEIAIVRGQKQEYDGVYDETIRLLARMKRAQPLLQIRELDPLQPDHSPASGGAPLSAGGTVIFAATNQRKTVDLAPLAGFDSEDLRVSGLAEDRAESVFARALSEVSDGLVASLCVATGHGEMTIADISVVHQQWVQEGIALRELTRLTEVSLGTCDGLLLIGPSRGLASDEVLALSRYLHRGGHMLIALRTAFTGGGEVKLPGLGLLLEDRGMQVLDAVVVDSVGDRNEARRSDWTTYTGYGTHPIVQGFAGQVTTRWTAPWALQPLDESVSVVVHGPASAWGETSTAALHRGQIAEWGTADYDVRSVVLAQVGNAGSRVVLFGSAESLVAEFAGNQRLFASAARWIVPRENPIPEAMVQRQQVRLLLTDAQLRDAFWWCVLGGPLGILCFGGLYFARDCFARKASR